MPILTTTTTYRQLQCNVCKIILTSVHFMGKIEDLAGDLGWDVEVKNNIAICPNCTKEQAEMRKP